MGAHESVPTRPHSPAIIDMIATVVQPGNPATLNTRIGVEKMQ